MSTHGAPRPSGSTYYGASYRPPGSPPAGQDPWAGTDPPPEPGWGGYGAESAAPASGHTAGYGAATAVDAPPNPGRSERAAHAAPPRPRLSPGPGPDAAYGPAHSSAVSEPGYAPTHPLAGPEQAYAPQPRSETRRPSPGPFTSGASNPGAPSPDPFASGPPGPGLPGPGPAGGGRPSPGPGFAPPHGYAPGRYEAGGGSDGFPPMEPMEPMDPNGFGPGSAPGTGYAVPGPGIDAPARPRARPNRGLPIVVGVLAVVLVLCIGGGAAAYFFFVADGPSGDGGDRQAAVGSPTDIGSASGAPAAPPPAASSTPTKQPAGGEEAVSGDLSGYRQGDCLTVDESDGNRVEKAKCTDPGAYKVLLRKDGTLDDSVCANTNAEFSLSQDASGTSRDFVLCVGPVS